MPKWLPRPMSRAFPEAAPNQGRALVGVQTPLPASVLETQEGVPAWDTHRWTVFLRPLSQSSASAPLPVCESSRVSGECSTMSLPQADMVTGRWQEWPEKADGILELNPPLRLAVRCWPWCGWTAQGSESHHSLHPWCPGWGGSKHAGVVSQASERFGGCDGWRDCRTE